MRHLLNCRECDWSTVVEGGSCVADVEREQHDRAIRGGNPECDVAWAFLPDDADVSVAQ